MILIINYNVNLNESEINMGTICRKTDPKEQVQLEISLDKLALLFESGLICAAEIRCLTAESKKHISDLRQKRNNSFVACPYTGNHASRRAAPFIRPSHSF